MKRSIALIALLVAAIVACDNPEALSVASEKYAVAPAYDEVTEMREPATQQVATGAQPILQDRKIIYRSEMSMEVADHAAAYEAVRRAVAKAGGYIADESRQDNQYSIDRSLTIRLPAGQLDSMVYTAEALSSKLHSKRVYTEDVSEEWVDIETRLKNKYAVEARYRQLLKQAKSIKGILQVEEKLRAIREEIESKEGRMRYLKDQVALSTLYLSMTEVIPYTYEPEQRPSFWERLLNSLDTGWTVFLQVFLGTLVLWPFLLLTVAAIWLIRRWRRRVKQQKQAVAG